MVFWPKRSFPGEILLRRFGLKLSAKISPGGARRPAGGELARRVVAPHLVGLAGGGAGVRGGVHAGVGQHAVPRDGLGVGRLRVIAPLS